MRPRPTTLCTIYSSQMFSFISFWVIHKLQLRWQAWPWGLAKCQQGYIHEGGWGSKFSKYCQCFLLMAPLWAWGPIFVHNRSIKLLYLTWNIENWCSAAREIKRLDEKNCPKLQTQKLPLVQKICTLFII